MYSGIENQDKFKSLRKELILNYRLKSQIKMDKHKLVRIIVKDLEEIKILAEEVAESQMDSALIIELALNRARLLCQEIELLRDITVPNDIVPEEIEDDFMEDEDDVDSEISTSDPELEILNFEENEIPENKTEDPEEMLEDEPEEDESQEDQDSLENMEEEADESDDDSSELTEVEDELENHEDENEENDVSESEEDDLIEEVEETEEDEDDEEEDEDYDDDEAEDEDEDLQQEPSIKVADIKSELQPGVREIHIDELDDEDLDPVQFSPVSESTDRPVMHEIPKPENPVQGKTVFGESFQKERSLNDVIGEKSTESKLTNGPITSLRAAIGLNDRFFFIREIFDNNTDKYNSVIEQLDKLETIQEAVEYLKANLSLQKSNTSLKFVDLLKRRFSK